MPSHDYNPRLSPAAEARQREADLQDDAMRQLYLADGDHEQAGRPWLLGEPSCGAKIVKTWDYQEWRAAEVARIEREGMEV